MNLDNTTIREAVNLWFEDQNSCIKSFGHISNWDTSEVTDMSSLFFQKSNFNEDIGFWNVSKVTNMSRMFGKATSFNQFIGSWNVGNVVDMSYMFFGATSFNQPIGDWNVSNVTSMKSMFSDGSLLLTISTSFNQPIGTWDVSNVIDMSDMFSGSNSFNQFIGSWNVSNVVDMSSMFSEAKSFNQPIGDWNVNNVISMDNMFSGATSFNQPIGDWDVSNVNNMRCMFFGATMFNQPIEDWNVSNVVEMSLIFSGATSFNQTIDSWDISNVAKLDDIIVNVILEATNFYVDEEDENKYFVAYRLLVIPNEDSEDMEGDLNWKMQEELSSEHLIFTWIGDNIEPFRIVDLPNIYWCNFENSTSFLLDDEKFIDAVKYIKDIKTISFKDLKSNNKYDENNYKTSIFQENCNLNIDKSKSKIEEDNNAIALNISDINVIIDVNGEKYNGFQIGTEYWITENTDITKYRNGDEIPQVQDEREWSKLSTGAWCYYENKIENGSKYGKLYNWFAVNDVRGLAPEGFHIPSDLEWEKLINYVGSDYMKQNILKAGGFRFDNGYFTLKEYGGFWWSSSEENTESSWFRYFYGNSITRNNYPKNSGFSVCFVKD